MLKGTSKNDFYDEVRFKCVFSYAMRLNQCSMFCNLMNNMLYEFLDDFMVMYLDDIVVFSTSMEDHVVHLSRVLSRLRKYKLFIKKDKCDFACSEIIFLGHLVSMGQVRMDLKKV